MSQRRGFLDGIRATPDDPTARLVYADWLDERGEHLRAELIRYQVASSRSVTLGPDRLAQLRPEGLPPGVASIFRGGFVEQVTARTPADFALADDLLETEVLHAMRWLGDANAWAASQAARSVDHLGLSWAALAGLAVGPSPPQCRTLRIVTSMTANAVGDVTLPRLARLEFDGLSNSRAGLASALRLCPGPLRHLGVTNLDGRPMSRLPADLAGLESLAVSETPDFESDVRSFVKGLDLPRLARFSVRSGSEDRWAGFIAAQPWAGRLTRVEFAAVSSIRGAAAPGGRPKVASLRKLGLAAPHLRELAIGCAEIKDAPVSLFRRDVWPALDALELGDVILGVANALSAGDLFAGLSRLSLTASRDAPPAGPVLQVLAAGSRLEDLDLRGFVWDRLAARAYLESGRAAGLKRLALSGPRVTDGCVADLARPGALPALEAIHLSEVPPDAANLAVERWAARCNLYWQGERGASAP